MRRCAAHLQRSPPNMLRKHCCGKIYCITVRGQCYWSVQKHCTRGRLNHTSKLYVSSAVKSLLNQTIPEDRRSAVTTGSLCFLPIVHRICTSCSWLILASNLRTNSLYSFSSASGLALAFSSARNFCNATVSWCHSLRAQTRTASVVSHQCGSRQIFIVLMNRCVCVLCGEVDVHTASARYYLVHEIGVLLLESARARR